MALSQHQPSSKSSKRPRDYMATLLDDIIKLFLSFIIIWIIFEKGKLSVCKKVISEIAKVPNNFIKLSVPAFLYVVQDNLTFIALENMDGAQFQTLFQLKLVLTSILSVLVLHKTITPIQWFSQCLLILGVAMITWSGPPKKTAGERDNLKVGVAAVLGSCVTSSIAGVYYEYFFKTEDPGNGDDLVLKEDLMVTSDDNGCSNLENNWQKVVSKNMWISELELALWSIPFGLIALLVKDGTAASQVGIFYGFTYVAWGVVCVTAVGGILSLIVVVKLDNIMKNVAYSLSFIPVTILSIIMFDTRLKSVYRNKGPPSNANGENILGNDSSQVYPEKAD
ncbi:CMP-sialic acid transporter-like [Zophobas morio]|uniref:CMP-sialic acid transporter-like n=1 Tax=Zophobas morio TaxID=2755281 RepID=UPI003082DB66